MGWTRVDTKIATILLLLSVAALALRHTGRRLARGIAAAF
jgi:hypothetical protein